MAPTVIVLADGVSGELARGLGAGAAPVAQSLFLDTLAAASALRDARIVVRYTPATDRNTFKGIGNGITVAPLAARGALAASLAMGDELAAGNPTVLIGANVPHLPLWRLRDAITHLLYGADMVLGPDDQGGCYLLGLREDAQDLLQALPGIGQPADALVDRATRAARQVALLPPWFAVRTIGDLSSLADVLHTMPPSVAANTRALVEPTAGQARAVGG
jgi:glycosyltransferase A (GT-A) superfamily protein (DUF2064 family)